MNLRFKLINGVFRLVSSIATKSELYEMIKDNWGDIANMLDSIKAKTTWHIWRYKNDDDWLESRVNPFTACYDYSLINGNIMLQEGAETIINAFTGLASITTYNNTNARIGVGDSSTAESASQTGLQGTTTTFKAMDTGYPLKSGTGNTTVEFQSVFGSSEGNHAWNEFTVDNGSTANKNLNRKVSAQGTKASGQTWTVKVSIQFS